MERRLKLCLVAAAVILVSNFNGHDQAAAARDQQAIESHLRHDRITAATNAARKGARRWRDRPRSDTYAAFRLLEARAFLARGNGAVPLAIANSLRPVSRSLQVQKDLTAAEALYRLGRVDDAETLADTLVQSPGLKPESEIWALNVRGQVLAAKERYAEADETYRAALAKADSRNDAYWCARILNNLGVTRLNQSRFDEAIPYFEKARQAIEPLDAPRLNSVFLSNMAICYNDLGDTDRSLDMRMRALAIQGKLPPTLSLANSYGEIGRLHAATNEPRKAIEDYQRAIGVAEQVHATADAALWAVDLAEAYVHLQDWPAAIEANDRARRIKPPSNTDLNPYIELNAALIDAGQGRFTEAKRKNEAILSAANLPEAVRWTAYDELGKVYARERNWPASNASFEKALKTIENRRASISQTDEKITFLSQPIRIYRDYVDSLVGQGEAVQAMLAADSDRAQVMFEDLNRKNEAKADLAGLQRGAAFSHSILLSYWVTPPRTFLWVVTLHEFRMITILQNEAKIRDLVTAYTEEITNGVTEPLENPASAGWELYDILLKPAAEFIPPGSNVIVIPDGPLYRLNLETLPVPGDKPGYWIEQVNLSIAPSLAGLVEKTKPTPGPRSILIVGDAEPVANYPRLPNARTEIESLERRFPRFEKTVLTGQNATIDQFREQHPERFTLIHFAAHAEANTKIPLDSAVILSPSHEEYKLYARDIIAIDKPLRADLVTISACASAGAKSYHGEGLIGFAWSFLHAGARNVIAALWNADDEFTAKLMDRMYTHLDSGQSPVESLRAAKLDLMHSAHGPYYWAPFQVYRRSF